MVYEKKKPLKTVPLITLIVALLAFSCFNCACNAGSQQTGVLEGQVTIGPIQPVERPGEDIPTPPEVYEARKVLVFNKNGNKLLHTLDLGTDGRYRIILETGRYLIDINRIGIDSSDDVPRHIEMVPGNIITLDIDIDTGIR